RGRLGAELTVLDGQQNGTPIEMDAGTVEGFTIRNGLGDSGGGIRIGQANTVTNPVVRHNIIESNRAGVQPDCCVGGGIYSLALGARIEWNTIRNNVVNGVGGGIYAVGESSVIAHNLISFNSAQINTGGVYAYASTVAENLIVGNFGGFANGGAYL